MIKAIILKSTAATGLMVLLFWGMNNLLPPSIWDGMELSKSALTVEYCEFNNPNAFFHQSMNTYSNLAYFFFGFIVFLWAVQDRKKTSLTFNRVKNYPAFSFLVAFTLMYLSFGSAFFHASLTLLGQKVDMNGTYGITIILVILGIYHLLPTKIISISFQYSLIIFSVALILGFYFVAPLVSSGVVVPILILTSLLLMIVEYVKHKSIKSIVLIVLAFCLIYFAIKIRTLDVQKVDCDPHSIFQGHAFWHLLTALSSFVTYCFYRFDFNKK